MASEKYLICYCKLEVSLMDIENSFTEIRTIYKPVLVCVNKSNGIKYPAVVYRDYEKIQLHRKLLPPKSKLIIDFTPTLLDPIGKEINYDPKKDKRNDFNYSDFLNSINRKKGKGGKNVKSKKGKASKGKTNERLFE